MKKLLFSIAVATTAVGMNAQEMAAAGGGAEATAVAVAVAQNTADGGQAVVDQAVAAAAVFVPDPAEFVAADELVEQKLAAGKITVGYNRESKAIVQIGTASIKVENPAKDPAFMMSRIGIANVAYLNAKADIIRAINTEFSAMDRMSMVAEFGEDPVAQKYAAKMAELEGKRNALVPMLAKVEALNAEEAAAVTGVTIGDRFGALMDAVVKKIDATYSVDAIKRDKTAKLAEKKAEADRIRSACLQMVAEYEALKKEAESVKKDPALESASDVKLLSEMPLLGSSVLTQAESWNPEDKVYTVSMAVVWSPILQEQAMKMISGDFSPLKKKGKYTVNEWVAAQNFSHMIGPRRFTDKDGMNLFVGINAINLTGMPTVKVNAAKKLADAMAMKYVAFSMLGDLSAYTEASQNLKVYDDDSKDATGRLSDKISASVTINLSGCMRLAGKTVKHPLTGGKIYVSAYYIDPALAKETKGMMEKLYRDSGLAALATKQKRAQDAGYKAMLARVKGMSIPPVAIPVPTPPSVKPQPPTVKPQPPSVKPPRPPTVKPPQPTPPPTSVVDPEKPELGF